MTDDRYGNRRFDQSNTTAPNFQSALPKIVNPEILAANNRLKADQDNDSVDDYLYDAAGNTTKDALNRTFVYDGENKQIEVLENNVSLGKYFYDGDGKRVKKYVPSTGETTIFVYDASGRLAAEYSTIVAQRSEAEVSYLTNDHLGSPRINTDANGNVTARHDYQSFGEEITRTSYGADELRKQFTSYERDIESELDFAKARYYSFNHGRFTSPDNFLNDTYKEDPASWNLYIYVRNNPVKYVDPSGEELRLITVTDKNGNAKHCFYSFGKLKYGFSMMPKMLPNGSKTVATRIPSPTSCTPERSIAPSEIRRLNAACASATPQYVTAPALPPGVLEASGSRANS